MVYQSKGCRAHHLTGPLAVTVAKADRCCEGSGCVGAQALLRQLFFSMYQVQRVHPGHFVAFCVNK